MRFSAGHQQRRIHRDGHHSMPPSIFLSGEVHAELAVFNVR
jgi:hypothetical protein